MTENFSKASISGKEVSCDRCGLVVSRQKIVSVYIGERGQKIDFCPRCFKD